MNQKEAIVKYLPLVGKIAYSFRVRSEIDKRDLVSEGYFGLIKAARTYIPGDVLFITYASYLIRFSIISYLKGFRKSKHLHFFPWYTVDAFPDLTKEKKPKNQFVKETERQVEKGLLFLSEKRRIIVRLIWWYGYTHKEIGRLFGMSKQGISYEVQKALKILKEKICLPKES